jgi:hypothetical protein
MSRIAHGLAMLAAGGATGLAGPALAAYPVQTVTLDIPIDTTPNSSSITPIVLAGGLGPQFYYETETQTDTGPSGDDTLEYGVLYQANFVSTSTPYENSAIGIKSSTPGVPAFDEPFFKSAEAPLPVAVTYGFDETAGVSYMPYFEAELAAIGSGSSTKPMLTSGPATDLYLHTIFEADGTIYVGTFYTDTAGVLESVSYEQVPEPDAWALLIAGTALTGAALRTRRRGRVTPSAA